MAIHKVAIDVVDMSIPIGNHRNLAVINQPNPCYGYQAAAREVAYLIQISSYYVYAAGTKTIINGDNFYDYFPEAKPGGGGSGGGGGVTPEEVATMIANAIDSSVSTTSTNAVQNAAITNFVNSSIESSTGQFRGTFETKAEMDLVEGSKNDYAFLVVRNPDDTVNHYERYKWVIDTTVEPPVGSWEYEYDVNNSSFTAEQWASINSGVKSSDVAQIGTNQLEISKIKADLTKVGTTFRGIFNTEQAMDAVAADKNDTAILQSTDANGNEIYSMYSRVEIPQVVPEGYTQLMYISSNGTQYIDTGVQAKRDLKSYIKFTRNSYSSGRYFGAVADSVHYELRFDNWSGRFYCDIGSANVNIPSESDSISEIVIEYPTVTVDDTVFNIPTQSDFNLEKNIYLCASNGNTSMGTISLYECIIYDADKTTELKHFYPCKNSSNVCGMYDIIEGVFYPDANGGNFTAGPQANGYWVAQYSIPNNLFSSAQFAALNSGINSTKVQQIETNKNNISLLESANGKKNLFNLESWKNVTCTRATLSISGTEITLTNTASDGYTNYTTADGYPQDCVIPVSAGDKIVATWDVVGEPTNGSVEFLQNGIVTEPYRVYATYSARYLECTVRNDVTFLTMRQRNFTGANTSTTIKNLMIYKKSLYDAGFTDYQPYTLSNVELTKKEQQNETNISLLSEQVGYAISELQGVL